ncbi:MAG: FadR family transcriptional regulator [Spirochaetaceae bacterium]|nr:FadR family transcriptional regulator [Spirochaetaceae bacterium]
MTLVDETQEKIRDMILSGDYSKKGYLLSEGEICEKLSVSRATTREAVKSLEVRGFVKRIQGKGIKIVNNSSNVLTRSMVDMFSINDVDDMDLFEVREIIEIPCARKAAKRATPKDISKMQACVETMERCSIMDGEYATADNSFHQHLVNSARNPVLTSIITAYNMFLMSLIKITLKDDGNSELLMHYHRNILNAIFQHNEDEAARLMRVHLEASRANYLKYNK